MSELDKLQNSIRKKLELNDYKPESRNVDKTESQQKVKACFYVHKEVMKKFDKVIAERLISGNKIDRSALISEMIEFFYDKHH